MPPAIAVGYDFAKVEKENQKLKTQVEMLMSALMGICKQQHIDIPQFVTEGEKGSVT